MTLDQILKNLENKSEVDSVVLGGSFGTDENQSYSDIDLAVILKDSNFKIFSLFQFIDEKPADIFFYSLESVKNLEKIDHIEANSMDAVLVDWICEGKIIFDKSSVITSFKEKHSVLKSKIEISKNEMNKWESMINSAFIVNTRYFRSGKKEYYEALSLKLMQDLYNLFIAYFEFRNIAWRGEKKMLKYLKENDISFYNSFMTCVKSGSIEEKFSLYSDLINKVFTNGFGLWNKDIINLFIKGSTDQKEKEQAVLCWKNLIN